MENSDQRLTNLNLVKAGTLKIFTNGFDIEENRKRKPIKFQKTPPLVVLTVTKDNIAQIKAQTELLYDTLKNIHTKPTIFDEDCESIIFATGSTSSQIKRIQKNVKNLVMILLFESEN